MLLPSPNEKIEKPENRSFSFADRIISFGWAASTEYEKHRRAGLTVAEERKNNMGADRLRFRVTEEREKTQTISVSWVVGYQEKQNIYRFVSGLAKLT